ncbi:MAG: dienelactone hydrolase family protein, partial [Bdellovibrionales bacterium]|nr:dienelactone hydrolase family protein [Bdellovibrionales bacterium]
APTLRVPVLGLYGEKDQGIPASDLAMMRDALKKSKLKHEVIVYPGAEHGFHADYRPSYQKTAAQDGWKRMLAWFRKNGV